MIAIYPSDSIPPRLCDMVKAHKPGKNYTMRTTVSTIGIPAYGISKYLDEFPDYLYGKQKNGKSNPLKSKYLHDVVNLYLAVPLDRSIQVIIEFFKEDHAELKKRLNLNLTDNHQESI